MALKIWLPLNGNINNKGLDEVCTAAGTLAYGDGKLGQALYMASPINANGILAPAQEKQVFTAMIWFKTPTYTGTIRYLFNEGRDYNTYGYGVHLSGNQNNIRAFIANASFTNYAITPDTWYHIAIARDADKKIYFYVNHKILICNH